MRNGPQRPSCCQQSYSSWQWQSSSQVCDALSWGPLASGTSATRGFGNNRALGKLAFYKRRSKVLKPRSFLSVEQLGADEVSHGRFFSMFPQVSVCDGAVFWGGLTTSVGAELWVFRRNTLSRKLPMAGGCAHLLLSTVHSVTAAVSGSRSKHGLQTHSAGMAWELAGNADSQSPPPPPPAYWVRI